jgi:hypothetical protein
MTREDFIEKLQSNNLQKNTSLSYQEIYGGRILVTGKGHCVIDGDSIPSGTIFNNGGFVDMSITYVSDGVEFINGGDVNIPFITSIGDNVKFENSGSVYFGSNLRKISKSVEFNEEKDINVYVEWSGIVWLDNVKLKEWIPIIEGIDSKRLFNFMIKKGLFI